MALLNPTPIVQAAVNSLLGTATIAGIGITSEAQTYYGSSVLIPIAANLPALVVERSRFHGSRAGYSNGIGTAAITGQVDVLIYVDPTDIGSLDTFMEALTEDLISQAGGNLNIIAVDVEEVALPTQAQLAGADAGQPGMPGAAFCTMLVSLMWE